MKKLSLFVLLMVLWILLVWPFNAAAAGLRNLVLWQDVVAGLIVALLAVAVFGEEDEGDTGACLWISPTRLFWGVVYVFVLACHVVMANFDVAYRVLHPDMPIKPGIIKLKTKLKSPAAITALANSITLTPGTLTVQAQEDGTMYVHWIYVRSSDPETAARIIARQLEWFLKRIFE